MNDGIIQKRKHNFLKKWKIVELKLEVSDIDTHLSINFQIIRDIKNDIKNQQLQWNSR